VYGHWNDDEVFEPSNRGGKDEERVGRQGDEKEQEEEEGGTREIEHACPMDLRTTGMMKNLTKMIIRI
jgi:hypothetical protein